MATISEIRGAAEFTCPKCGDPCGEQSARDGSCYLCDRAECVCPKCGDPCGEQSARDGSCYLCDRAAELAAEEAAEAVQDVEEAPRAIRPVDRIVKAHVGRPADFLAYDEVVYNGRVEGVRNGVATFRYYQRGAEIVTYLPVRCGRVEVY